jgi:imidazolonepropionase-like amidohydrolase
MRSLLLLFACFPAYSADLLIRGVTVVDIARGQLRPGATLRVHDGRIEETRSSRAGKDAEAIDGTGKYAIPGLWDMHVHLWYPENQFAMYLPWGVTGVRDMGSDLDRVRAWQRDIASGRIRGPHVVTCGSPLDGEPSGDAKLPVLAVKSAEEARKAVDRLATEHVDFIKVLSGLSREAYFAAAAEAKKKGLSFSGHVADAVTAEEASDAGQKIMEHLFGVLESCSRDAGAVRAALADAVKKNDGKAYRAAQIRILDTYDESAAEKLFRHFKDTNTWQVPTLTMHRRTFTLDAPMLATSPELAFISPAIHKDWKDPREERASYSPATAAYVDKKYSVLAAATAQMQKVGVHLLAGTDTGDPYSFPGDELHRELEAMVKAGLTPREALASATIAPAAFFGETNNDLVLLDGNPLADITNTRKIAAIVLRGEYLSHERLDSMLK